MTLTPKQYAKAKKVVTRLEREVKELTPAERKEQHGGRTDGVGWSKLMTRYWNGILELTAYEWGSA